MPKVCDMEGVRGSDSGFPVSLWRDEDTLRLVVRGINEGGYGCVDIDLIDLIRWMRTAVSRLPDDAAREFAQAVGEHIE
jgi:hypothetical protein